MVNECVNYILDKDIDTLISLLGNNNKKSNTLGHPRYYLKRENSCCKKIVKKYGKYIDEKKYFVKGTNFMCDFNTFVRVINFMKENSYKGYFLNNMYDTIIVNLYNSPIHFIERLFGYLK